MSNATMNVSFPRLGTDGADPIRSLREAGIFTFTAASAEEFHREITKLGRMLPHRDADEQGVTVIEYTPCLSGKPGYQAMGRQALEPHTDSTGKAHPPRSVALFCESAAGAGGEALFIDGHQVYNVLCERHPEVLRALSEPESAVFRSGDSSFVGSVFSRNANGSLQIRFRSDNLGYYSSEAAAHLVTLHRLLASHVWTLGLRPGQGYLIDNHRYLHGRRPFQGSRRMLRILLDMDVN